MRKEIVRIALKHTALKAKVFEELFSIPLWFGLHSRIIKETVHIIHDLKIYEAESYLTMLARKKPFWYNDIKQQAHNVLEQWKNGKS